MRVAVHKAQRVVSTEPVDEVRIDLVDEFPRGLTIEGTQQLFEAEADEIAGALIASLPGGTLDRLTAKLLARKATSLVVPL